MKNINIFCFGFGQVAKNFIKKLIIEKYNIKLTVTSRNESSKEKFNGINFNNYLFNGDKFDNNLTVIIIAHRLTTLKNCDMIVKLGDNHQIEIMNYADIMNLNRNIGNKYVE